MKGGEINILKGALFIALVIALSSGLGHAATGDLLATVNVPVVSPTGIGVGGTFDGTNYIYVNYNSPYVHIMTPPPGNGTGTLVASKPIVDTSGTPVEVSVVAWDSSRGKLWAASGLGTQHVYLIDISGSNATATLMFTHTLGGISLTDGLAYDASDDTLYYSPDVNCNVYHYTTNGTLLNTVTPKNAAGVSDCRVSGVEVGSNNTLYIGRDGAAEIRRVDKTTGAFISTFATTSGRVEDLTCDPITYAPKEAILAKDAYNDIYEAFEVEAGTCPLQGEVPGPEIDIKPGSDPNSINPNSKGVVPVAMLGSGTFDATTVDPSTCEFGPSAASPVHKGHSDDVNGDGYTDLVLHFRTRDTGIAKGDTEATLACETYDGDDVQGTDSVRTVGK